MDCGCTRRLRLFNDGALRAAAARLEAHPPKSVVWSLAFLEGSLGLVRGTSCVAASACGAQGGGRDQGECQAVSLGARHVRSLSDGVGAWSRGAAPIWGGLFGVIRAHLRQIGADLRHLLLAAVPPDRLIRLRSVDPDRYEWVAGIGWPDVVDTIRAKPVEMAVVYPLLGGQARAHGIERLRLLFPSLPLLVYTELAPATASVLLQLGRSGIRRVVFHRFEDAPASLRSALQAELEQSASQQVMQAVGGALQQLPHELLRALEAMLHAGDEAPTVTALAERAQLTRRTCERWFTKVGLPSPRTVMVLTRLLYAHRLLLDPGYTVEDVALKLGYSKTKTLQMHLRAVFGVTAGELRVALSTEEALMTVTERYLKPMTQAAS